MRVTTKALIIPAAGSGSRMKKETPKPYLQLSGKTILELTIRRFLSLEGLRQVIVPTSPEYVEEAEIILQNITPEEVSTISIEGGDERQDSIHNALERVSKVDLVIVHDAVRPFVKEEHIASCCEVAADTGGAVLGVPAKDTIKRIDDNRLIRETPSRKYLWQTQTPQVFRKEIILEAYEQAIEDDFTGTDDSSLVERLGRQVKMVEGDRSNFKITYPLDMKLAKLLMQESEEL